MSFAGISLPGWGSHQEAAGAVVSSGTPVPKGNWCGLVVLVRCTCLKPQYRMSGLTGSGCCCRVCSRIWEPGKRQQRRLQVLQQVGVRLQCSTAFEEAETCVYEVCTLQLQMACGSFCRSHFFLTTGSPAVVCSMWWLWGQVRSSTCFCT